MKVGDLVKYSLNSRLIGIIVKIHENEYYPERFTVDVLRNTGKVQNQVPNDILKVINEKIKRTSAHY